MLDFVLSLSLEFIKAGCVFILNWFRTCCHGAALPLRAESSFSHRADVGRELGTDKRLSDLLRIDYWQKYQLESGTIGTLDIELLDH